MGFAEVEDGFGIHLGGVFSSAAMSAGTGFFESPIKPVPISDIELLPSALGPSDGETKDIGFPIFGVDIADEF